MGWSNLSIRTQIQTCVGFIAIVTVGVIVILAVGIFVSIGNNTKNLVNNALVDSTTSNLLLSAQGMADVIDRKFASFEEMVNITAEATPLLFRHQVQFADIESYYWWNTTLPTDMQYEARYDSYASLTSSCWYIPHTYPWNVTILSGMPTVNFTIARSAHLDRFFPSQMVQNPDIAQLQVGFGPQHGLGKVFRRFPAVLLERTRDYDQTNRPWYIAASNESLVNGRYVTAYVSPYRSSVTGNWTIGVAKAIWNPYPDSDYTGFMGVVLAEVRLKTIADSILAPGLVGKTGYAILIEFDGTVVASASFSEDSANTASIASTELFLQLQQPFTTPAITEVTIDGVAHYAAQASARNTYLVIYVLPKSEALASLTPINNQINSTFTKILASTIAIGVITAVLVFVLSSALANQVTIPIKKIATTATQIAKNATATDIMDNINFVDETQGKDEISELSNAFASMITKLMGKSGRDKARTRAGSAAVQLSVKDKNPNAIPMDVVHDGGSGPALG